jgi:hypothetical protein
LYPALLVRISRLKCRGRLRRSWIFDLPAKKGVRLRLGRLDLLKDRQNLTCRDFSNRSGSQCGNSEAHEPFELAQCRRGFLSRRFFSSNSYAIAANEFAPASAFTTFAAFLA